MKVLVVDDDVDLLDLAAYALRREGHTVSIALDGLDALHRWELEDPDIIVLDLNLPKLSGFEVCRRIRHESQVPIIMLSGRHEEEDIVGGLALGADDYVTKPFSLKQLRARINAVLRRHHPDPYRPPESQVRVAGLVLDPQSHETIMGGEPIQLTPIEFRILFMLSTNPNRVTPYSRLVDYAWGYAAGDVSLLKTHVCRIREKLRMPVAGETGIKVVPRIGYRFIPTR